MKILFVFKDSTFSLIRPQALGASGTKALEVPVPVSIPYAANTCAGAIRRLLTDPPIAILTRKHNTDN